MGDSLISHSFHYGMTACVCVCVCVSSRRSKAQSEQCRGELSVYDLWGYTYNTSQFESLHSPIQLLY